jgi:SAM-dependent methyltransferase
MPMAYARGLEAAVFVPFASALAERAASRSPKRMLELAAGTGVLTRALVNARPGSDLIATDLNPAMVALGRRREWRARWAVADAAALPVAGAAFDVVCCAFGVMFFPDRVCAYRETRRSLAPGGRFLFTSWDRVNTHAWADALGHGLRAAFPHDPPPFVEAVPHGYTNPDRIRADLADAGFDDIRIERVLREGTAEPAAVAEGFCTGTPLRAQILERGELATTVATVAETMTALLGTEAVAAPMTAYLAEGRRPH